MIDETQDDATTGNTSPNGDVTEDTTDAPEGDVATPAKEEATNTTPEQTSEETTEQEEPETSTPALTEEQVHAKFREGLVLCGTNPPDYEGAYVIFLEIADLHSTAKLNVAEMNLQGMIENASTAVAIKWFRLAKNDDQYARLQLKHLEVHGHLLKNPLAHSVLRDMFPDIDGQEPNPEPTSTSAEPEPVPNNDGQAPSPTDPVPSDDTDNG